jgi:hypothetical protein
MEGQLFTWLITVHTGSRNEVQKCSLNIQTNLPEWNPVCC